MSLSSDAEIIGRALGESEAFGLIHDRHAATLSVATIPGDQTFRPLSEEGCPLVEK